MSGRKLTPTQELFLDVLAARWRLGDTTWTFTSSLTRTARELEAMGLVSFKSGSAGKTILAWLTLEGQVEMIKPGYMSSAEYRVRERKRARRSYKTVGLPVPLELRKKHDPVFVKSRKPDKNLRAKVKAKKSSSDLPT